MNTPQNLQLVSSHFEGMKLLGERYAPMLVGVDPSFETAFLTPDRQLPTSKTELKSCIPDLQVCFSGFDRLQSDPQIYLGLNTQNEEVQPQEIQDYAFYGVGVLILQSSMFSEASLEGKKWEPALNELRCLGGFLECLARDLWRIETNRLVARFSAPDEPGGISISSDQAELCFQLTASVPKKDYLDRLQVLNYEVEQAQKHVAMTVLEKAMGVGAGQSNGGLLQ